MPESGNFPSRKLNRRWASEEKESSEAFANPDSPRQAFNLNGKLNLDPRASFFCFPAGVINNMNHRGTDDKPTKRSKARKKDGKRRRRIVIINAAVVRRSNFRPCLRLKMDPSWWIRSPATLPPRFSIFWSTCLNRNENPKPRRKLRKSENRRTDR